MLQLKFGIELPQHLGFAHLKHMALSAESLGYDSIWVRDHVIINLQSTFRFAQAYIDGGATKSTGDYMSCFPGLAALAAVTSRITLGTDIYAIPRRHPVDVANEAAAIDQISGGRFILQGAVGQATRDWDPSGVKPPLKDRGEMLEEALAIIKLLWTHDEPISFHGKHYTIENARVGNRPVQKPHLPIWLGVRKTFKRVARHASGFTLEGSMFGGKIEDYARGVTRIREEARRIGRDPDEIEAGARFGVVVGETDRAGKERALDHWTKLWDKQEPWFTEWAGSPETVANVIAPFIEAGARHIMLWPIPYASPRESVQDIRPFAEKVIPLLRKRFR